MIAQNTFAQVDHEGYSTSVMVGIIDCKKDESLAVPKAEIVLKETLLALSTAV